MHYLIAVLVESKDNWEEQVREALAPFDQELEVDPYEVDCEECDAAEAVGTERVMELLTSDCPECRGSGVVLSTRNPNCHWDWYQIGGRYQGWNGGNMVCPVKYWNEEAAFGIVTLDGEWIDQYTRPEWLGSYTPTPNDITPEEEAWSAEFKRQLEAAPDAYIVLVDCHM